MSSVVLAFLTAHSWTTLSADLINFGSYKFEIKKYVLSQSGAGSTAGFLASWLLPLSAFFAFFRGYSS